MQQILLSWLIMSVAVWLAAAVVPGVEVKGLKGAVAVAAIFGLLNWAIGWLIFVMIGFGTLGLGFLLAFLTRWLVNAIVLKLTDALTEKLTLRSFRAALLAALVMSGVNTFAQWLLERGTSV